MRRPIGKRIEQVCAACEQESTLQEIGFLLGMSDNPGNAQRQVGKAVAFGFVIKTGQRNTARYTAVPNWKERIAAHNAKPQAKKAPDYAMVRRTHQVMFGKVNSVFQLGAMQ